LIRESLELSIDSLKHRKTNTILTVLGIVIGITAVISLMSIGEGFQYSIETQLQAAGSDKIMVMSASGGVMGGFLGEGLNDKDIDMIQGINGVEVAIGSLFKSVPMKFKKESLINNVIGLRTEDAENVFTQMKVFEINEGRYFKLNERGVAILGELAVEDVFEKELTIGDTVAIKGVNFKIIGVLKSTANRMRDSSLYIPMDQLRDMTDSKDSLTMVIAKVPDLDKIEKVADKIEEELDDEYGEGFYEASTTQQIAENVGSIFAVISFVLGGIASIALVVAGVGIANTMFTSVMERTKEIGVMKAIGATNIDVMQIFLIESSLLGLLGGVVGLFVGFLLSLLITIIAEGALPIPFKTIITLEMAIGGLLFSIIVGVISGIFPARTAAKLQPVDALRR